MKSRLFFLPALALFASSATATVLDFEDLANPGTSSYAAGYSYTAHTYTVSVPAGDPFGLYTYGTMNSRYAGSTGLRAGTDSGEVTLTQGGAAFELLSIDLAGIGEDPDSSVTFVGHFSGSPTTVTQTVSIPGGASSFQTYALTGFKNVTSVTWTQDAPYHQFDNITAVPEPTSMAALSLGSLAILGKRRLARLE